MTFWAGPGGDVVVNASVTLHCNKHTVRKTSRLAENSHSGVAATNFEAVIPHYEWTVEVPWDSDNMPDSDAGLIEGDKVAIRFNDANSSKFCILTNTSVETIEQQYNSSEGIFMAVITGKGGTLTREVG